MNKLNEYGENITSQHGEDGIIEYIVKSLEGKIITSCCEFGAWDGVHASNCYNLWRNKGWDAILIEGDKAKFDELKVNTSKYNNVDSICSYVQINGENSLDKIFMRYGFPENIGVLSIDIDSYDYHIWDNMQYVIPQIVIIEHNQYIPPYIEYFDDKKESYLRCSAKSLELLGKKKGYKLICCTISNSIFIKNELFDDDKFPDYPVEYLFDYSSIQSQIIMTGTEDNRYPIFSGKISKTRAYLQRIYYRLQSLFKKNVNYIPPSEQVVKNLKKFGLKG